MDWGWGVLDIIIGFVLVKKIILKQGGKHLLWWKDSKAGSCNKYELLLKIAKHDLEHVPCISFEYNFLVTYSYQLNSFIHLVCNIFFT